METVATGHWWKTSWRSGEKLTLAARFGMASRLKPIDSPIHPFSPFPSVHFHKVYVVESKGVSNFSTSLTRHLAVDFPHWDHQHIGPRGCVLFCGGCCPCGIWMQSLAALEVRTLGLPPHANGCIQSDLESTEAVAASSVLLAALCYWGGSQGVQEPWGEWEVWVLHAIDSSKGWPITKIWQWSATWTLHNLLLLWLGHVMLRGPRVMREKW